MRSMASVEVFPKNRSLRSEVLALGISILASALPAYAAEMVPIPRDDAYCGKSDAYCFEWKLVRDPSVRFVATGYEDGGGYYFYRRSTTGVYRLLFAVYPALLDAEYPDQIFWGYAWDIKDIVLEGTGKSLVVQATFNHHHADEDDANWSPPKWQRSIPYVLFKGTTTQPEIKVNEALRFGRLSFVEVRRRATAKP